MRLRTCVQTPEFQRSHVSIRSPMAWSRSQWGMTCLHRLDPSVCSVRGPPPDYDARMEGRTSCDRLCVHVLLDALSEVCVLAGVTVPEKAAFGFVLLFPWRVLVLRSTRSWPRCRTRRYKSRCVRCGLNSFACCMFDRCECQQSSQIVFR